jgi:hypothetical protein
MARVTVAHVMPSAAGHRSLFEIERADFAQTAAAMGIALDEPVNEHIQSRNSQHNDCAEFADPHNTQTRANSCNS